MNDTPSAPFTFADTTAMTPDTARAEQGRTMTDPAFQRMLNGGGAAARERAMGYLEQLGHRQVAGGSQGFGKPGVTASDFKADPAAQAALAGKDGTEAQLHARNQLSEVERMEALAGEQLTEAERAEIERIHTPNTPLDFATMTLDNEAGVALRQELFKAGVSPAAAKIVAMTAAPILAATDEGYNGMVDSARDTVLKWPGGRELIADAVAFVNGLPDNHPLSEAAIVAAANPQGIAELARLYRKKRAA
jgi:hypothetical protein